MKKLLLTVMLVSGLVLQAFAQQTATVTATIIDSETNLGVPGAVLEMTPLRNPDQKKYTTSDADGKVSASGVPYGKYTLKVTFIGYEPSEREFVVSQPRVNLGVVKMSEGSMKIDAVKIEVQSMRTSQKGDTVSYNSLKHISEPTTLQTSR